MQPERQEVKKAGSLLQHLQFLPNKDNLLTSSAEFWFFSARILVFVMASAEAAAWGYLGFLFGDGAARWIGAAFVGGIVFLVVWMIDVSLITMDCAYSEHATAILGQQPPPAHRKILRNVLTFGVRVALLIGSLTITAPYLAQLVFTRDIQHFVDAEATSALDLSRRRLASTFDARVGEKSKEITERQATFEKEVAGEGISGRYGMGPTAQAIAGDMKKLEGDRNVILRDKETALKRYDGLVQDWRNNREELAARYNVDLPETTILENRKALEDLRKRPENRSTEMAIRAFLGFIFVGLLLLKLFEPSSVHLYLSEVLQQQYNSYLAGTFDDDLPPTERHDAKKFTMSPQQFYDFLTRIWIPARRRAEEDQESMSRAAAARKSLRALQELKTEIEQELFELRSDRFVARGLVDRSNCEFETWKTAQAILEGEIQHLQTTLDFQILKASEQGDFLEDEESLLEYHKNRLEIQSRSRRDLANARLALSKLQAKDGIPLALRRAEEDFAELDDKLRQKEAELVNLTKDIRDLRQREANHQVRTVLHIPAYDYPTKS